MKPHDLRDLIVATLERQGFQVAGDRILTPRDLSKEAIRGLHSEAVGYRAEVGRRHLQKYERTLLKRIAAGPEVVPERMQPRLVEVQPDSDEELLFRYASLHWSIPVSSGYGRRLRFIVLDQNNNKLVGLFGLGDPVFALAGRDQWVGWDHEARRQRLHHVMDAFVLGAVPPYASLLCGKLVAMLVTSNEVREAFRRKYGQREAVISRRPLDGQLALVTTTSALGRSSLYNRIVFRGRRLYYSVGFTRGSGEFHFSNGMYGEISRFVEANCRPTAKHSDWGRGFRNRREVIRKCLDSVGLSADCIYHGVRREIYVTPLAENTRPFLRGEHLELSGFDQTAHELFAWFRERWLLPRAERDQRYLGFDPADYALWVKRE